MSMIFDLRVRPVRRINFYRPPPTDLPLLMHAVRTVSLYLLLLASDVRVRTNHRAIAMVFVRLSVEDERALSSYDAFLRGYKFVVG